MRLAARTLFLFALLPLLAACGSDGDTPLAHAPGAVLAPAAKPDPGRYPMEAGRTWVYEREFTLRDAETGEITFTEALIENLVSLGQTEIGGVPVWELESRIFDEPGGATFYLQTRTQVIEVASRGLPPVGSPVTTGVPERPLRFAGREFASPGALARAGLDRTLLQAGVAQPDPGEIVVREEPRIALDYPLKRNKSWVAFSNPFRNVRTVIGKEKVEALGRTRTATRIHVDVGIDESVEWDDYIGREGVLYRRIDVRVTEMDGTESDVTEIVRLVEVTPGDKRAPRGNLRLGDPGSGTRPGP